MLRYEKKWIYLMRPAEGMDAPGAMPAAVVVLDRNRGRLVFDRIG